MSTKKQAAIRHRLVMDRHIDQAAPLSTWGVVMLVAAILATILLTTSLGAEGNALGGIPGLGRAVMVAIVQWLH